MPESRGLWDLLFSGGDDGRLARLEAKVEQICRHLGLSAGHDARPLSAEVKALARQPRKKFAAVKLHREQTGAGLQEAEEAVAAYLRARRKPRRKAPS